MNGELTAEISFPIISLIDDQAWLFHKMADYVTCRKAAIPIIRRIEERIIDRKGILYRRGDVKPLGYINRFWGFSLQGLPGFGMCYVKKEISKLKELSIDELKEEGRKILEIRRDYIISSGLDDVLFQQGLYSAADREIVLGHLFWFTDPRVHQ